MITLVKFLKRALQRSGVVLAGPGATLLAVWAYESAQAGLSEEALKQIEYGSLGMVLGYLGSALLVAAWAITYDAIDRRSGN